MVMAATLYCLINVLFDVLFLLLMLMFWLLLLLVVRAAFFRSVASGFVVSFGVAVCAAGGFCPGFSLLCMTAISKWHLSHLFRQLQFSIDSWYMMRHPVDAETNGK